MIFLDPKEEIIKQARQLKALWDVDPGNPPTQEEMGECLINMMAAVKELEEEENEDDPSNDLVN